MVAPITCDVCRLPVSDGQPCRPLRERVLELVVVAHELLGAQDYNAALSALEQAEDLLEDEGR